MDFSRCHHLWQARFASFPMDENYLPATTRYIDMHPVAAGLVAHPEDYPGSGLYLLLVVPKGYISSLLLFELDQEPGVPLDDVQEVSNYVAALDHGLRLLAEGLPLSLRLFREIHGVLLTKGRGSNQTPGQFRRSQNWIGGSWPGNFGLDRLAV